jgi:signal transduction histidine kinase
VRSARSFLALLLLLGALVGLARGSRMSDANAYGDLQDRTRQLRELSARLDRAALEARAATMQHYDGLVDALREMREGQAALERRAAALDSAGVGEGVQRLRRLLQQKEALVEAFLSANSVLRNSSAYFPRAVQQAMATAAEALGRGPSDADFARLLGDVLWYRTRRTPEDLARFQEALARLAARGPRRPGPLASDIASVARHGGLIATFGPQVDGAMRALLETDNAAYDQLYATLRGGQEAAIARANRFRAGLAALGLALIGLVAATFRGLRRNAAALQAALSGLEAEKLHVEQRRQELRLLNRELESRVDARTAELASSKEQYRGLLESTQAVPWETAPGTLRLSYVGPQAVALLGLPPAAWLHEGFWAERLDPGEREATLARLRACSRQPGHHELELRLVSAAGRTLWLRCLASTSANVVGPKVMRGILLDVTAQRQLEAELRAAQKLESVGRLASGIAHEINTPVQFVSDGVQFITESWTALADVVGRYRGLAALAASGEPAGPAGQLAAEIRRAEGELDLDYSLEHVPAALTSCRDGLGRIASIVRSMKEFAHPDQRGRTSVDLNRNISSTLTIARTEYKRVADLDADLGELPPVWCQAGEINQVVLNVVVNAAHAIADVVKDSGERGRITVRTRVDGNDVLLTIADTGAGIPAEVRDRIFDPFFTTKEVGRGTGQGLAIARSVLDRHGGRISFQTEVGRGTTFFIRLPVSGPPPPASVT